MRIGILTFYYKNWNYGGLLQSYALQKYLHGKGNVSCMQISFDSSLKKNNISLYEKIQERLNVSLYVLIKWMMQMFIKKISIKVPQLLEGLFYPDFSKELNAEWKRGMQNFMEEIPHTETIYSTETIIETNKEFDLFVCGSDQIWNPRLANPYVFGLGFTNKNKVSYAASIAVNEISECEFDELCKYICRLNFVSIREERYKRRIEEKLKIKTSIVVDPVFLLSAEKWRDAKRQSKAHYGIGGKYIFAYLLGDNQKHREYIKKIAKKNNLKIVYIPYSVVYSKSGHLADRCFGDYRISKCDPFDFLDLIDNAELVITDSFHASAFSIIFHKDFYSLERVVGRNNMNSRLETLLYDLELTDRLKNEIDNTEDLRNIDEREWSLADELLDKKIVLSKEYIASVIHSVTSK